MPFQPLGVLQQGIPLGSLGPPLTAVAADVEELKNAPGQYVNSLRVGATDSFSLTGTMTEYESTVLACDYPGQLVRVQISVTLSASGITAGQYLDVRPMVNNSTVGTFALVDSPNSAHWITGGYTTLSNEVADGSGNISVGIGARSQDGTGNGQYRNMAVMVWTR